MTNITARQNIAQRITTALVAAGYTVSANEQWARLKVAHTSSAIGALGDIKLTEVFAGVGDKDHVYTGTVVFQPQTDGRDGRYTVQPDGRLNLDTLLARITATVNGVQQRKEARRIAAAAAAHDEAVLVGVEQQFTQPLGDITGLGRVEVFNGLLDFAFTNLTPERAVRILRAALDT